MWETTTLMYDNMLSILIMVISATHWLWRDELLPGEARTVHCAEDGAQGEAGQAGPGHGGGHGGGWHWWVGAWCLMSLHNSYWWDPCILLEKSVACCQSQHKISLTRPIVCSVNIIVTRVSLGPIIFIGSEHDKHCKKQKCRAGEGSALLFIASLH